jgi:hypothetical protein
MELFRSIPFEPPLALRLRTGDGGTIARHELAARDRDL